MSNDLNKFVETVKKSDAFAPNVSVPQSVAVAAMRFIEARLKASAAGGRLGKRKPVKFDRKSTMARERVRRHRAKGKPAG